MRMKDKVALISGAAGGMGAATARLFAREGAKAVIVADLLDKEGEATVADIVKTGGKASYAHLDVTDEGQWKGLIDRIMADHGHLDETRTLAVAAAVGDTEAAQVGIHAFESCQELLAGRVLASLA